MSLLAAIKVHISRRVLHWHSKRSGLGNEVQLNHKTIYILPTRYGLLMLGITILMAVGATNYQSNLIFIATFACLTIGLMGILLTFNNLIYIQFSLHPVRPIFAGENARLIISATAKKQHIAVNLGFKNSVNQTLDVTARAEQRVELSETFMTRGVHPVPAVKVSSQYPFGFFNAWSWLLFANKVIVYPAPIEPPTEQTSSSGDGNELSDNYRAGIEDFYGLKAYQPGELMSRIHWKSFAREKGLQTKLFVDYISDPDVFDFDHFDSAATEMRLSYLTYLVVQANRQSRPFGIKLPQQTIAIGSGEDHLHKCLYALATFGKSSN
ncbi:MAG: DUF58 domain-containing protein [Gammaproteobacteria bacterium]|nr:DUF58 domain-containing protein [Gammaproteobacteria bacterium]